MQSANILSCACTIVRLHVRLYHTELWNKFYVEQRQANLRQFIEDNKHDISSFLSNIFFPLRSFDNFQKPIYDPAFQ